ncbi:unnamed protein product [Clavelina lepadiformis]|uniref:G-protein coupled receptors family 2 profile 2 domain-containing protein n=1 Tax=Clavelina lepadiformis TaxID=159417 RepID=A0ABP0FUF8_CLALP
MTMRMIKSSSLRLLCSFLFILSWGVIHHAADAVNLSNCKSRQSPQSVLCVNTSDVINITQVCLGSKTAIICCSHDDCYPSSSETLPQLRHKCEGKQECFFEAPGSTEVYECKFVFWECVAPGQAIRTQEFNSSALVKAIDGKLNTLITTSSQNLSNVTIELMTLEDLLEKLFAKNSRGNEELWKNGEKFAARAKLINLTNPHDRTISLKETTVTFHARHNSIYDATQAIVQASEFQLPVDLMKQFIPMTSNDETIDKRILLLPKSGSYVSVFNVHSGKCDVNPFNVDLTFPFNLENVLSQTTLTLGYNRTETMQGRSVIREITARCFFLDFTLGRFSDVGCDVIRSENKGEVGCRCNHTTIFTILLSISSTDVPHKVQITSFVTQSISVLSLIVTLIVLLIVRKRIKGDRIVVQINLTLALLLLHTMALFHDVALRNWRACEMITVVTHWMLLASGGWMMMEGLFLHLMTSSKALRFSSRNRKKLLAMSYLIGWIIPAVIVLLAACIGFYYDVYMDVTKLRKLYPNVSKNYPMYDYCWLNGDSGARLVALCPLALVWGFNSIIAIKTAITVAKLTNQRKQVKSRDPQKGLDSGMLFSGLKTVTLLLPTLGLAWIFAFHAGDGESDASLVFLYLNAIFNGLQGFFVFLIYCAVSGDVKTALSHARKQQRAKSNQFALT